VIPPRLTVPALEAATLCEHGFFGRAGGVSTGVYTSLNAGPGSNDDPAAVTENRARCARALGAEPDRLVTCRQAHTSRAVVVRKPWPRAEAPEADAMATDAPGLVLGVLAADCMPFLFVDADAKVIGAAHAGWRGALKGVLEACVEAMTGLGAEPARIRAAVGPCLRQPNFEVGMDLVESFETAHPESGRFFAPGASTDKRQFDLVGFGRWRLETVGVTQLDDVAACTLGDPAAWFSHRASKRAGAEDYGRNLSAIVLKTANL